jgi:hypothetical protein
VLSGGPTIRAFAAQPRFLASAEAAVAAQQRAAVSSAAAGSWLSLRLQLMAAAVAAAVAGAAVAQHAGWLPDAQALAPLAGVTKSGSGGGGMAAGLVGLSLSYVLPITGLLSALLTSSAETGEVQKVQKGQKGQKVQKVQQPPEPHQVLACCWLPPLPQPPCVLHGVRHCPAQACSCFPAACAAPCCLPTAPLKAACLTAGCQQLPSATCTSPIRLPLICRCHLCSYPPPTFRARDGCG